MNKLTNTLTQKLTGVLWSPDQQSLAEPLRKRSFCPARAVFYSMLVMVCGIFVAIPLNSLDRGRAGGDGTTQFIGDSQAQWS